MIEKKISYEINIEKPSKTKPVKQGGVFNYLGKQKTVNAPRHWRSSPKHPIAHLSYITKDEQKILIDLNLYGSLKGKPNRGPFGLPSLQGSGSGSGGDGGSSGGDSGGSDSGPGGSDDGSGHGGPGPGDSGPGGSDDGTGHGGVGSVGPSDAGFGIGPDAAAEAEASNAANAATTGVMGTISNAISNAFSNAMANPGRTAVGMAFGPAAALGFDALSQAVSSISRGVTAPNDYSQATDSVQSAAPSDPSGGGGITTLPEYAPLVNQSTGDPLLDSLIARYRANLPPSSFGIK